MSKRTRTCILAGLLSLMAVSSSCIGPFNATRRIHTWNREIENRWVGEAVFLGLKWLPVYTVAFLGDVLLLNSLEFWGADNWVDPPSKERIKALQDKDDARAGKKPEAAAED